MRVAVACDHAGFLLKESVVNAINQAGHEILDFGTYNAENVDFPDFAMKAGHAIQQGKAERAVLICGSGVGVCITANKMKGVYASVCHDIYSAHQGVEHDKMNTLCLGGQVIGPALASEIVRTFLSANFIEEERFQRRVNKMLAVERSDE